LGMGFSEHPGSPRTAAQRIADLGTLTDALGIDGPVVTIGHDWGGMLSLGWALAHLPQLRGVVLANTAVAQPAGDAGPALIRFADLPGVRQIGCVVTSAFVRGTPALSKPVVPRPIREALALPYRTANRRRAVGEFVADIPFSPGHPSYAAVADLAEKVRSLAVPALLLWGPRDPVFGERYLADLRERLPHAQLHRFEGASHLVTEDAPQYAEAVFVWAGDLVPGAGTGHTEQVAEHADHSPQDLALWSALDRRSEDLSPVISAAGTTVSWSALSRRVNRVAAGMRAAGIGAGDRIGLLVEPSVDLVAVVYAAWRAGAVVVIADKGLGFAGMRRALRGAQVDHVVGALTGLTAARAMGLPGSRISVATLSPMTRRALGVEHSLETLADLGLRNPLPAPPDPNADCAVVFTSGATGPAKGVVYRHRQLCAQLDIVRATYGLRADDTFVAAFAPFALLGPALGIGSVVPDIDVTAPDTLTASLLADAAAAVSATAVFASPAALRRVVQTAADLTSAQRSSLHGVRLLMSAGAPVPASLLEALAQVLPTASLHTPYGMTEVLPVTDITLEQIQQAGPCEGVCVGQPLDGVEVGLVTLNSSDDGAAGPVSDPDVTGEICVRAAHVKDRYDALWLTERASTRYRGWHRTGDVGHLDNQGRLWVEGRMPHLITTADAVLTPVGIEQRVESIVGVQAAAAAGVGPTGAQVVAVVVVADAPARVSARLRSRRSLGLRLAASDLTDAVRRVAGAPVAAVLVADRLPLDIRHASKVDRSEVSRQTARLLAGRDG
ncbi:MAG: alpha/beta fold hydrolase, partial [Allobranchiibius sp.]